MVQYNSDRMRNLEFFSLLISIIGWPMLFISLAILTWYILVLNSNNPVIPELGSLLVILFGISWNTRYNIGGIILMQPFKNYLQHTETEDDRSTAQFSFLSLFFLIFSWFVLLSIIIP